MKKKTRKGLQITRSISALLLSIGMAVQPMVPAISPLVVIHAEPGDTGETGETPAPSETPTTSPEATATPTPTTTASPTASTEPTETPSTELSIGDDDVKFEETNGRVTSVKIHINGDTSAVKKVSVNYDINNTQNVTQGSLNGNGADWDWTTDFGTDNAITNYEIKSIDVKDANDVSLLHQEFTNKTFSVDKINFSIEYKKENDNDANYTKAVITDPATDNKDFTLAFYKDSDLINKVSNDYSGTFKNGNATVDFSDFVQSHADADNAGDYIAKIHYGDKDYTPKTGTVDNKLTITQAPYVISSSISGNDSYNRIKLTNGDVIVSVTLNEALNDQGLKLNLGDNRQIILGKVDNTNEYKGTISKDGTYNPSSFELVGSDVNGVSVQNVKALQGNQFTFTIDKTSPVITDITTTSKNNNLLSPSTDGSYVTTKNDRGEKGFTLNVTTKESLSGSGLGIKYKYKKNDNSEAEDKTIYPSSGSNNSYYYTFTDSGVYYNFTFDGTDAAGNNVVLSSELSTFSNNTYKIDDEAPTITLNHIYLDNKNDPTKDDVKGSKNINFGQNKVQYVITVKDDFGSGLKINQDSDKPLIQYAIDNIDGTYTTVDPSNINKDGDTYTVTINAPKKVNTIYVKAVDNVNNEHIETINKPVVIENIEPKDSVITVSDNNKATDKVNDSHKIEITAEDDVAKDNDNSFSGIKNVSFYLTEKGKENKIPLSESNGRVTLADGENYNLSFDGNIATISRTNDSNLTNVNQLDSYKSLTTNIVLKATSNDGTKLNGTYTLHVTATDYCGNSKEPTKKDVEFDTQAPSITLNFDNAVSKDADGKYYYNGNNAKFTVNVKDEDNGSGVADNESLLKVSGKDADGNNIEATKGFTDTYSGDLATLSSDNGKKFADGEIKIEIKAADKAGNTQNTYTADSNNPGIALTNDDNKTAGTFVYDTTAPVATVTYATPSRKEENVVFYKEGSTKEAYVSVNDTNFDSSKITVESGEGSTTLFVENNNRYETSFSKDGKYHLTISGTDKAGNPVVVRESDITNSNEGYKQDVDSANTDNSVTTANEVVVDTVSPVVTITYNNPSNTAYVSTESALYYGSANKDNQSVSFAFNDQHVEGYDLVDGDLHVYQKLDNTTENIDVSKHGATVLIKDKAAKDGTYSYSFDGSVDRAGNPVKVVETYTGVSAKTQQSENAQYHIVVDNTNPVASINVNAPHSSYGGRDYYGSKEGQINATFTVTENNFDSDLIKYGYAVNKDGKFAESTVNWEDPTSTLAVSDGTFTGETGSITGDGVYKLEIKGHDKAMNPIVAADDQLKHPSENAADAEKLWTNEKVLDTAVNALLKVTNVSGNEYFSVNFKTGSKGENLFRDENQAIVTADATDDERSPYKIKYTLKSSLQDANIDQTTGDDFKYGNQLQYTVNGDQRFHVVSAYIEDMAGNTANIGEQTEIYLDTVAPNADDINKPLASIQAHATSNITARTPDGRDLYADGIKLDFNITDPNINGKITSSGLKNIVYTVKADGVVVQHQTGEEDKLGNSNNPNLFNWHKQITVDNDTNNISVEFYGYDNAGHKSNTVSYNFGIDKTAPVITVNYDNNDAQHDKYFKANRTATVTVQDRNIDFSKINIKTQVGHSNLSAAVANSTGNGNNDTRTFTIPYTQDGDYTLDISGTDAVNHPANVVYNGTAPQSFTIDKTAPVIKVSFDNNDVQNGKYYKAGRTATININEHNFLGNEVNVDQTATIQRGTTSVPGVSGFSTGSDSHNATIRYNQDGNYTLTVNYTDMAGNKAEPVTVSEFTIDQTAPVVKIEGVKNNAAYNGEVMPTVTIDDTNFSSDLASFVLNGIKIKDRSNLLTSRVVNEFGATIRFENIAAVKDNDDVYTATAVVTDLAGNVTRTQVRFSVNRFGSTYDYGNSATKSLMTKYYDNKTGSVLINEINVNQLHDQKVYLNFNGGTEELEEGKDYKITVSQMEDGSGYRYTYEIFSSVFKKQGTYSITVQSVDEAGNINTNATVKEGNDVVDVPFEFAIDTTNPVITSTENLEPDVLWTKTHDAEHTFSFTTTDNMSLSKLTYAVVDSKGNPIGKEETLDADQLKNANGMVSVDLRSANTNQYIKLTAVDAAGNTLTATYSIYMNANALSRAWHFYWYIFLLVGAGIVILVFLLIRNSKNKKKAA